VTLLLRYFAFRFNRSWSLSKFKVIAQSLQSRYGFPFVRVVHAHYDIHYLIHALAIQFYGVVLHASRLHWEYSFHFWCHSGNVRDGDATLHRCKRSFK